jgi:hypothetical protein
VTGASFTGKGFPEGENSISLIGPSVVKRVIRGLTPKNSSKVPTEYKYYMTQMPKPWHRECLRMYRVGTGSRAAPEKEKSNTSGLLESACRTQWNCSSEECISILSF